MTRERRASDFSEISKPARSSFPPLAHARCTSVATFAPSSTKPAREQEVPRRAGSRNLHLMSVHKHTGAERNMTRFKSAPQEPQPESNNQLSPFSPWPPSHSHLLLPPHLLPGSDRKIEVVINSWRPLSPVAPSLHLLLLFPSAFPRH